MKETKVFIDTNIFVYAKLESEKDTTKRELASALLRDLPNPIISTQVLNEFASALLKHHIDDDTILQAVQDIAEECAISAVTFETVERAWAVRKKYKFSYWDSLIIASSLENACLVLYTEDMQHNQMIEKNLRIINPFAPSVTVSKIRAG